MQLLLAAPQYPDVYITPHIRPHSPPSPPPPTPTQLSTLGRGSFGCVVLAQDMQTQRPVAIKLLYRGPQVRQGEEKR